MIDYRSDMVLHHPHDRPVAGTRSTTAWWPATGSGWPAATCPRSLVPVYLGVWMLLTLAAPPVRARAAGLVRRLPGGLDDARAAPGAP